jgi:branched-chain amino acid transport system substrate-binding protein
MKRCGFFAATGIILTLGFGILALASAGQFTPPTDPIEVVTIRRGAPIRIAYMLVVAGADETLGIDSRRGIEMAIEDVGGKVLDHPIELVGEDSGCNAEGGTTAATKLAADRRIVAVIGSSCSSEARPGAPIISKAGMVMVSPSNTAPFLTDANRGQDLAGYLRTAHNDKVQGAVAAQFAVKQVKVKTAATMHDGSPYADQLQQVFADTFKQLGGKIVSQEAVKPDDTDMRPVLTRIATAKPELIYYPIFIAAGGHITRQAKEVAGLEKTILMSADGTFSPDFLKAAGKSAEGMYHSSPDFTAFGDKYFKDFLPKHEKKYGGKPLSVFHAHAYDAAMLIFEAIKKAAVKGPDGALYIGRKALRDALFATKDFKGLTGNLTCTPQGDCADPHIAVYQTTAENIAKLAMPDKPIWKP